MVAANEVPVPKSIQSSEDFGIFTYFPSTPNVLYLFGDIQSDQVIEFRKAVTEHDVNTVVLVSPGGDVQTGLLLAGVINDRGLTTYIPKYADCASACSYMFLAGQQRLAHPEGSLGVHQFAPSKSRSAQSGDVIQFTQDVMANIFGMLSTFDVPPVVIQKMLDTPPDDMYYFRESQMRQIERGSVSTEMENAESLLSDFRDYIASVEKAEDEKTQPKIARQETPAPKIYTKPIVDPDKELAKQLQTELNKRNCDAGYADGVIGARTKQAFDRFIADTTWTSDTLKLYPLGQAVQSIKSSAPASICRNRVVKTPEKTNVGSSLAGEWASLLECKNAGRPSMRGKATVTIAKSNGSSSRYSWQLYWVDGSNWHGSITERLGKLAYFYVDSPSKYLGVWSVDLDASKSKITLERSTCKLKFFRVTR